MSRPSLPAGPWDAIVVGAGSAGLATSYWLKRLGVRHVVLERGEVARTWRHERWDSFHLNTPNSHLRLPGMPYRGPDPAGFLARDEVVEYLVEYARRLDLPVRPGVEVTRAAPLDGGWRLETGEGTLACRALVVAAGAFTAPKIPPGAQGLPDDVFHVHTSGYRNPDQLPAGAVLVVGTAQSGVQVAEDLVDAGRRVFLCVGRCPRTPRRYRGRDIMEWFDAIGFLRQRVEDLPSSAARNGCHPQIAGRRDPPDLDVRYLAGRGAVLLGHFLGASGHTVRVADDVEDSLRAADEVSLARLDEIDAYIAAHEIESPPADPKARDVARPPIDHRTEMDLASEGVASVVWATGFEHSFPWLDDNGVDADGFPVHRAGVAAASGLYFVGLHFLRTRASGLLAGVGEDAQRIAARAARWVSASQDGRAGAAKAASAAHTERP